MKGPDEAFRILNDEDPSQRVKDRMIRMQRALDIRDGDAINTLLAVLVSYQYYFEKIPSRIKVVLDAAEDVIHEQAEAAAKEAALRVQSQLASRLAETVQEVALTEATSRRLRWSLIAGGVALAGMLLTVSVGGYVGYQLALANTAQLRADTQTELDAARYANQNNYVARTQNERNALIFARMNNMSAFMECSDNGWEIRMLSGKPACLPINATSGWWLP